MFPLTLRYRAFLDTQLCNAIDNRARVRLLRLIAVARQGEYYFANRHEQASLEMRSEAGHLAAPYYDGFLSELQTPAATRMLARVGLGLYQESQAQGTAAVCPLDEAPLRDADTVCRAMVEVHDLALTENESPQAAVEAMLLQLAGHLREFGAAPRRDDAAAGIGFSCTGATIREVAYRTADRLMRKPAGTARREEAQYNAAVVERRAGA